MTDTPPQIRDESRSRRPEGRRFGYFVAAAVNAVVLWIAHHLLEWEWPRFLTADFDEVLPILSASLVAAIVVNLLWVVHDPPWLKALGNVVTSAFGVAVGVRTWQVFPFDFSTYSIDWSTLIRVAVAVGVIGSAIGLIVHVVRLVAAVTGGNSAQPYRT